MKKSMFYFLFLILAVVLFGSSLILYYSYESTKKNIYNLIFERLINEISSRSKNIKDELLKKLPKDKNWYLFLKKHPQIRKELEKDFSLLITHNVKYIYVLGLKKNKFIFLIDSSKVDRADFGETFEPANKNEFYILKPHYFFNKKSEGIYLTYIEPIIVDKKLKALIVIDIPFNFLNFINAILNSLNKYIFFIIIFSVVFSFILIIFAFFDYKREKEKEFLLKKLQKINEELEENVKKKVEEIRKKDMIILHQSKLASLGEMLTMIAHQWRQPLNSLSAAAITIELKNEMKNLSLDECVEFAKFVEEQTQKLSEIIEDFMNLSKPNKNPEEFYIKELIQEVLKLSEVQLKNHNIQIEVNVSDNLKITSYKKELSHVLLNLISNARDALDSSNQKNKVLKIYTKEDDKYIQIIIEDNAGGIPEKIKERIFEPYFTTKSPHKGTGIGLYMSKKLVEERLKGELFYENIENGVRFIIKLNKENK